jgi:glyoxylase I family protein
MYKGFHHVAIKVKDFDASYKFYTEELGCEPKIFWGEGDGRAVMLHIGNGCMIELFAGGPAEQPEGLWMHLAIKVDNSDEALARALKAGAVQTMPPTTIDIPSTPTVATVRISFCTGLDGEILEFFQSNDI